MSSEEEEVPLLQSGTRTRCKVSKVVHTWTINHFSYHCDVDLNGHDYLESSRFSLTSYNPQMQFFVRLYPRGEFEDAQEENQVSLYLHMESDKIEQVSVQLKVSIMNGVGLKSNIKEQSKELTKAEPVGWTDYVTHEDILDEENRFLCQDILTLCCEVAVVEECMQISEAYVQVEKPLVENGNILDRNRIQTSSTLRQIRSWTDTKLRVDKFAHMWTIDNFVYQQNEHQNTVIESTKFHSPNNEKMAFFLELYPSGIDEESENHVSVYLNVKPCEAEVRALYEISILDKDGAKHCTVEGRKKFTPEDLTWGWPTFVTRDDLLDVSKGLLLDDSITIYCEITLIIELLVKCKSQEQRNQNQLNRKAQVQTLTDLGTLLDSGKFTDVVFVFGGGKKLSAHKAILAARSPVFEAMFEHEMEEKRSNRVTITDVPAEVFLELLRFTYSAQIEPSVLDLLDDQLLVAADKYQLDSLKSICELSLCSKLTSLNVGQLLILADMYSAERLKGEALQFINSQTDLLSRSGVLKAVLHYKPQLFYEIFCPTK